ncbi:hypothetical protein RF55_20172 [Lasius niger]|uniref:Uncharacterized protein n=1 Tax=Lasius niger TaxID=67767 RepID=A0A0J7JZQ4_LASNI|nr:hypothetical protein RF55_20172 [Lasius niger]
MTQEVLRAVSGESGKSTEKSGRAARANHVKSRKPDSSRSCPLCKKEHFMAFCDQYKQKSAQERREAVATHQRCCNWDATCSVSALPIRYALSVRNGTTRRCTRRSLPWPCPPPGQARRQRCT